MNIIDQENSTGENLKIAIVVARFNDFITKKLLDGSLKELQALKVSEDNITVVWVPGAFEIPLAAKKLAKQKNIDAVICLGCVIKGETYHFDTVLNSSTDGIMQVALETEKPIVYEVLGVETVSLAQARAEEDGYNKGEVAAEVAVEMANAMKAI